MLKFNTDKIKAKAVVDVAEKLNGEVKEENFVSEE